MSENISLKRQLKNFSLSSPIKLLFASLKRKGFLLEIIPQSGNFSEYISYVLENKNDLKPESEYVKNNLLKEDSWGEVLIIKKRDKIVASFGPNRVEKDKKGKIKARQGYFSVLPEFRGRGMGTVLWWLGMERMKKMGAEYVQCSVEKGNIAALTIYLNFGMTRAEKVA